MSFRFSLIFPLTQERGLTTEAITAWARQTLQPEQFEIIVVADDRASLEPAAQCQFRPSDRIVRGRFTSIVHQFDAGMRTASGEYVFLTESHCLPAPDCLEAMDRFLLANPQLAGACCESIPKWDNAYQAIDAATFEEGYRHFLRTDDWRKLSVHGMALNRDVCLALGGFQHGYGRFAEMLLAAALRDAGHELGYAPESIVSHHYRDTLQELIDGTDEYVTSECLYRAAHPGPDRVGHTYWPALSNPFSPGAAAINRSVATALLTGAFGRKTKLMLMGLRLGLQAVAGLLGRHGPILSAWLELVAGRIRCWRRRHDVARLNVPYRELIRLASVMSRARFLATQPVVDPELPAPSRLLAFDQLPGWALHGFHDLEKWNGHTFRWSGPIAAVQLPLVRGQYRLRLVSRGVRMSGVNLQVAFNGTRIEPTVLPDGDHELAIERWHCNEHQQTLMFICEPLCPWKQGVKDYRELGLPIFAVEAIPVGSQLPSPSRAAA